MKRIIGIALALVLIFSSFAYAGSVRGDYRKNGAYVAPHYRSSPNYSVRNNYSYKGNYNPYSGRRGTNYYRNSPTSGYYGTSPKRSSNYIWGR